MSSDFPSESPALAAKIIERRSPIRPKLGLVLGSGFGGLRDALEIESEIQMSELPGFLVPCVPGHSGRVIIGRIVGVPIIALCGRSHYYEGGSLDQITFPIRVLAEVGISGVVLTNAAGAINPRHRPGDFMLLSDHLNLMGDHPLRGPPWPRTQRFVDLSNVYDPALRSALLDAARSTGVTVHEGVYAAMSGPSYETPAEIRALRILGADAVGMSTVHEAIVARQCGLRVLGLSCLTNMAAGVGSEGDPATTPRTAARISHEDVLEVGRRMSDDAKRLLSEFVVNLRDAAG